jgi:hypothetical protein
VARQIGQEATRGVMHFADRKALHSVRRPDVRCAFGDPRERLLDSRRERARICRAKVVEPDGWRPER